MSFSTPYICLRATKWVFSNGFGIRVIPQEDKWNCRGHSPCEVERIDPFDVPKGILSLHQARYEFARQFCVGKVVLDVACGAGYGSVRLASVARHVTGCDLSRDAITIGRNNYQSENLTFLVEDARELPFRDGVFDTAVSFETIEHLNKITQYLGEVRRVLKRDGIFIVSTPKARKTVMRPKNPHHTMEFSEEDFRGLLEQHFSAVEMYGQMRIQGNLHYWLQKLDFLHLRYFVPVRLRHRIDLKLGTSPFEEMELSDQRIVKGDLGRAHNMIAVCLR